MLSGMQFWVSCDHDCRLDLELIPFSDGFVSSKDPKELIFCNFSEYSIILYVLKIKNL